MIRRTATRRALFGAAGAALAMPLVARAQSLSQGMPPDLAGVLAATPQFSKFLELVSRAGFVEDLRGTQPMTLFVPVNIAFDRIPAVVLSEILGNYQTQQSFDRERLRAMLSHHAVAGARTSSLLMGQVQDVASMNGGLVRIDGRSSPITVAIAAPEGGPRSNFGTGAGGYNIQPPAPLVRMDIPASNGIIHAIDGVLLA
jgi:uncharacterized surface protein with fasciclin (FAS1) repeats